MASFSQEEEINAAAATEDVMNLLQTEASPDVSTLTTTNIPALREQLAALVSTVKAKEAIGEQSSHEQVKRLTDKEVAAAHSSAEIRRAHTQRGPPSGPSFSAPQQTASWAQSFQIRADHFRRAQSLQRGRTLDLEKF